MFSSLKNDIKTFSSLKNDIKTLDIKYNSKLDNHDKQKFIIPDYLKKQCFGRKLECVALCVTSNEIKSGRFDRFISNLIEVTGVQNKQIHFRVFLNNDQYIPKIYETIEPIKEKFESVEVISLDIPREEDTYFFGKNIKNLKYGTISGPNIMFLKTMQKCANFNTTLILETDCTIKTNWLEKLERYVENCGGFWISGSLFNGFKDSYWKSTSLAKSINGVALYATGNTEFQIFINIFDTWLVERVKRMPSIAYDHAIALMIEEHISSGNEYWVMVNRNYISNQFIINLSPDWMKDYDISKLDIYDYVILHKK